MGDKKIHIPARRMKAGNGNQPVIRVTPECYQLLVEIVNESGRSIRTVASRIIIQAIENDLIVYDWEEDVDE